MLAAYMVFDIVCALLARLSRPSPGDFTGPLAGGGTPGRHPLIYRCSARAAIESGNGRVSPGVRQGTSTSSTEAPLCLSPCAYNRYWCDPPPCAHIYCFLARSIARPVSFPTPQLWVSGRHQVGRLAGGAFTPPLPALPADPQGQRIGPEGAQWLRRR